MGGGELRAGTVASPYPTGKTFTLIFDENGTGGNYGLESYPGGKITAQGEPKTTTSLWKTTYVSGAGTAADPMIVTDAVDWAVNDEIIVCAYSANATNYNESENKFIKTKNSATSYVISDTAGGAEAALAFTHTAGAYIVNVTRNVVIKSSTTTEGFYYFNSNTTAGEVNFDWVRFETIGANITSKQAIQLTATNTSITANCDYSVAYRPLMRGFWIRVGAVGLSFTGLIGTGQNASSNIGAIQLDGSDTKTLTDCFAIKNNRVGFVVTGCTNCTLTRCIGISNNTVGQGTVNTTGGFGIATSFTVTLNSCEAHCNRIMGLTIDSVVLTFNSFLGGTKGTNAIDVNTISLGYISAVFINSSFGSVTFVNGYLAMAAGSELRFQTLNLTTNNHVWYTSKGIARSSGAGLVDTTNKTAGNLTVRLAPEDATSGFVWEFLVGIKASTAASIFGFAQKNVAFGTDVCTVELFLPGSTVSDATATLDNTTGAWQVFNLAASYTGLVAAFATVRITAKTTTASAYVYFTDFYNGTNVLTGLQAWYNGKPTPVMTDLLGDPASVWAILESTQTTVGTMGYEILNDLLTLRTDVDDLQTRVPAALVSGRMDSSVGAMAANTLTASALAADAVNEIVAAVYAATLEGLTFEKIIKEIWAQVAGDAVANDATNPTQIDYDGPDGAIELTHMRTATTRTRV